MPNGWGGKRAEAPDEELAEMLNKSSEMETAIKEVLELFDANGVPNIEWVKNRLSEAVK